MKGLQHGGETANALLSCQMAYARTLLGGARRFMLDFLNMKPLLSLCLFTTLFMGSLASAASTSDSEAIAKMLDSFHDAASKADGQRYFDLFSKNAVFLGTDATERWTLEEFKAYAQPFFEKKQGWTYKVTSRHIDIGPDGRTAWFDEMLKNDGYGTCRGSGVVLKIGNRWKVTQYNLSIPIPNALAKDVVQKIRNSP